MAKKSITVDVDESMLKALHFEAIDIGISRKHFLEECIQMVGDDKDLLNRVKENIEKQKSPTK